MLNRRKTEKDNLEKYLEMDKHFSKVGNENFGAPKLPNNPFENVFSPCQYSDSPQMANEQLRHNPNSFSGQFVSQNLSNMRPFSYSDECDGGCFNYPVKNLPKIKHSYITDNQKRSVTLSKRRKGLMKKGFELGKMTGASVLVFVVSEHGRAYTYSTDDLSKFLNEYRQIQNSLNATHLIFENGFYENTSSKQSNESSNEYVYRRNNSY